MDEQSPDKSDKSDKFITIIGFEVWIGFVMLGLLLLSLCSKHM